MFRWPLREFRLLAVPLRMVVVRVRAVTRLLRALQLVFRLRQARAILWARIGSVPVSVSQACTGLLAPDDWFSRAVMQVVETITWPVLQYVPAPNQQSPTPVGQPSSGLVQQVENAWAR